MSYYTRNKAYLCRRVKCVTCDRVINQTSKTYHKKTNKHLESLKGRKEEYVNIEALKKENDRFTEMENMITELKSEMQKLKNNIIL